MSDKPLKVIAGAPDKPLVIGGIEIPCYVLEDETRVLTQRGMQSGIGMGLSGGDTKKDGVHRIAAFLHGKGINPYVSNDLTVCITNPVRFQPPSGGVSAYGYPASILVDICRAILAARAAGALQKQQLHIAQRCEIVILGLASVGINALVDEVTGYQEIRTKQALATILEKFIDKELQPWTKTFPFDFYEQIYRLKGWQGAKGPKRPSVIGHYTNDIVYSRLAPGILDELKQLNPTLPSGARKNRHHQWFTPDVGHPRLKEHLAAVTAFMRAAPNWITFQRNLKRAFPKKGETQSMLSDDE